MEKSTLYFIREIKFPSDLLKAVDALTRHSLTSVSIDEILLPRRIKWFTNFNELQLNKAMTPS